ncbi:sirt2 [Symbiodinium sp. CCMP2456]|nr:sirt2 [Symbiodinium sp. CCMP2456]
MIHPTGSDKPTRPGGYAAAVPGNLLLAFSENVHWIQDVTDPLADDFRNLKEPGPQLSREGAFFVVEGPEAIRLLLASEFAVTKLLLKPSLLDSMAEALVSRLKRETSADAAAQVMLLLCEASLMEQVTGIPAKHASAALAIARRRAPCGLQEIPQFVAGAPFRALALERGLDEESVGALFRVAAAFGATWQIAFFFNAGFQQNPKHQIGSSVMERLALIAAIWSWHGFICL